MMHPKFHLFMPLAAAMVCLAGPVLAQPAPPPRPEPPPPSDRAELRVRHDDDEVHIRCGEEALGPCLEAARPVLEHLELIKPKPPNR